MKNNVKQIPYVTIGKRRVGPGYRTYVVAELSCNHNQDLKIAKETIKKMADVGVDAVKLQTYTPDTLTIKCDKPPFRIKSGTLWDGMTLYELYAKAYTPWEWHHELWELAENLGLQIFSTPFDNTAVDYLESNFKPVAYKIASFEANDPELIGYAAKNNKPMIISTGMSNLSEIQMGVEACHRVGNNKLILLKCTSAYPAPIEEANLLTIPDLRNTFGVVVGLSDHSLGMTVPVVAVSLGASVVEKHFILDKKLGGPDAEFSLEPTEFGKMIELIRETEKALGNVTYVLSKKVEKSRVFARSLFVVENVRKGEKLTSGNIRSIRPGYGMEPKYYQEIIGKKASINIERGTPLARGMFE